MQWLIPVVTGLLAVWQWTHERDLDRQRERKRVMALYVNPFLSACEDLQSRIYNILILDGLVTLRKRYPDGKYAEETLYLIVRFFGWLSVALRYGPYTQDSFVIHHCEAVRNAFATSDFPIGPFAFFRPEQKELGKIVMTRFKGQYGIELDTVPWHEFMERLEKTPLAYSQSVQQSIQALREAQGVESLLGRDRLCAVQNHLIDLLSYIEKKEGFSLFSGRRKKCVTARKRVQEGESQGNSLAQQAPAERKRAIIS
ncbi:MAG: hypothetical protein HY789_02650 [Deltaproteobacteria bacterium]|nr:hypothetical protein [Deltaproteobacteria bacterium]